ncbi:beta-ketoacyl-[acyl-carrier-protein] synthase family protein (plasmid) [Embleya sp. NBC_00888]|uniref:beta-ketoacyl-[acyl-carrier-protein] synthase family protein n=1 Tax=Embleya sp. NBC_00888 TaxID=2975960 RepID=UPI002F90C48B|nr:beta-ketoacyl-[acyl-carrier-protein] synthase family protein [Embleya sp. NBC_00888]
MPSSEVAVTGLGLVTAGGIGVEATWRTLCAGVSTARRDPGLAGLPVDISCTVPGFAPDAILGRRLSRRMDRSAQMTVVAAREALADAALDPGTWDPTRVGVVIGAGGPSMESLLTCMERLLTGRVTAISPAGVPRSLPNTAATEVGLDLGAQGTNFAPAAGCASGATALGVARDLLRAGTLDIVFAGGVDIMCNPLTAAGFAQLGALSTHPGDPAHACRPFDAERDGFVLGEGVGIVVLERPEHAHARRARVRSLLSGYGAANDAHHLTAPHPDGRGARLATLAALADAGWNPADVDHVNTHGTGTLLNDAAEARFLAATFDRCPPITAVKSVLGHTGGAGGAIEAIVTVLTLEHGSIPPTANHHRTDPDLGPDLDVVAKTPRRPVRLNTAISTSVAFGGQNAVLAFRTATSGAPS